MNQERLYEILGLKRGYGSVGEQMLIDQHIMPYKPIIFHDAKTSQPLAYAVIVGDGSKTLFSAHTDSVHGRASKKVIRPFDPDFVETHLNNMAFDPTTNMLHADGDVLGADDGAGVWLLLEMIDAGVPGTYMFHVGEECGGIGSSGMARHHGKFLQQFDRAVAFDRKGVHSVITHQAGYRGCSDEFADALADALSCDTYFFAKDDGGVFTDTANYTDHIGETTNVSVGYYNEHTQSEKLDLHYLFNLCDQCITLAWETLPTKRAPGEIDPDARTWGYGGGLNSWMGGSYPGMSTAEWKREFGTDAHGPTVSPDDVGVEDLYDMDFDDMLALVEADPYVGAALLWELVNSGVDDADEGDDEDADTMRKLKAGMA